MIAFKLAWRNLWRNRRRTFITVAMVFVAAVLSIIMQSVQHGVYERNIDNLVTFSTGYVQVNANGHFDDKTIETSLEYTEDLRQTILKTEGVEGIIPMVNTMTLAAGDSLAREGLVMASDPESQDQVIHISERIDTGRYITADDDGVVISTGLAERLKVNLNDTIVLLGLGYHGISANGRYPVVGLISLASPELNKRVIYMPIKLSQELLGLENRVTNLTLLLSEKDHAKEIAAELDSTLGADFEAKDWEEMAPTLAQMAAGEYASGYMFMAILYIIISFGVFGTILMMVAERKYEFGVVTALGMKRRLLAVIVVIENFFIAIIGALVGMVGALPVVLWLYFNPVSLAGEMAETYEKLGFEPVILTGLFPDVFYNNAIAVFFIAMILSIYPMIKILRMKPIENLRA